MIEQKESPGDTSPPSVVAEQRPNEPEPGESATQTTFRGKPISWVEILTSKTVLVAKNAFEDGEDDTRQQYSTRHLIAYDGKE